MQLASLTRVLFFAPLLAFSAISTHAATITFTASLSGSNQVPVAASAGSGTGTFVFDTVAQDIMFTVSYSGLTSSAMMGHIHNGAAGMNGPIILPFSPSPTGTSGTLTGMLTAANLINQSTTGISTFTDIYNAALAGNLYTNIHTMNYPAGEIRGQLTPASAVPEPMTGLLFASGLLAIPVTLRLRRKA